MYIHFESLQSFLSKLHFKLAVWGEKSKKQKQQQQQKSTTTTTIQ